MSADVFTEADMEVLNAVEAASWALAASEVFCADGLFDYEDD